MTINFRRLIALSIDCSIFVAMDQRKMILLDHSHRLIPTYHPDLLELLVTEFIYRISQIGLQPCLLLHELLYPEPFVVL